MSLVKISELPQTETIETVDVLPIVNGNATKKVSIEQLQKNIGGLTQQIIQSIDEVTEPNILYLLPETTVEDNNKYKEYMYINGNAELIGSSEGGASIVYDFNISFPENQTGSLTEADKTNLATILQQAYKDGASTIVLNIIPSSDVWRTYPIQLDTSINLKQSDIQGYLILEASTVKYITFNCTWSDDSCVVNYGEFGTYSIVDTDLTNHVLRTDNNTPYTPTDDYNPATKLYVDEAIGGALNGTY